MNRKEFMKELSFLLQDLNDEDREEALAYYEDYFDEAGKENEASLIKEFGDPSRIAAMIKDGINGQFDEHIDIGNDGVSHDAYQKNYEVIDVEPVKETSKVKEKWQKMNSRDRFLLIVLLIIAIVPTSLPFLGILGGIYGVVFGIIFGIAGVFFGFCISGLVLSIVSIALIVKGVLSLFIFPGAGLIYMGLGLCLLPIGLFLMKIGINIVRVGIPSFIRMISDGIHRIFFRGDRYEGA